MRRLKLLSAMLAAAAMGGCGNNNSATDGPVAPTADLTMNGFPQPAGTVPVNFKVNDSANKVYAQGDLQWKGAMIYDPATRKITKDSTWGGPWAPLWDDGPWTSGGHEPAGETAGDHIWGITVFATPPAMAKDTYEYGLNDNAYQTMYGNGWVWKGMNGTFDVAAGATMPVTAQGQTFAPFGTVDMQLTIDLTKIDMTTAWDTSKFGVKGSAWAWGVQTLTKDAAMKGTFTLSAVTGSGKPFNHTGLLTTGDKPEFIFVFGSGATPKEYKDASGNALATGITAGIKKAGDANWTPVNIALQANKNTYITVP